jgi:hypothetical protein
MALPLAIYPGPHRPVDTLINLLNAALRIEGRRPSKKKLVETVAHMLGCASIDDLPSRNAVESLPDGKSPPHVKEARWSQYEMALQPFKLSPEAMGRVIDVVSPAGSKEIEYLWVLDHPKVPAYARDLGVTILEFATGQKFDEFREACFAAINDDPYWDFRQAAWADIDARFDEWTGYENSGLRLQLTALRLHGNHPMWAMMCLAFIICAADSKLPDPDWRLFEDPTIIVQSFFSKSPAMFVEGLNRTSAREMLMLVESFRQQAGAYLARARKDETGDGSGVSFSKGRPWEPLGKKVELWLPIQRSTPSEPWVRIGSEGDFEMTTTQEIEPGYYWIAKAEYVKAELPADFSFKLPLTKYGKRNIRHYGKAEGGTIAFAISDDLETSKTIFARVDIHHRLERITDDFDDNDEACYHTVWVDEMRYHPLTGATAVICAAVADDLRIMMGSWERVLMPGSDINVVVQTYAGMKFGGQLQNILNYVLDASEDGFSDDDMTISATIDVEW